MCVHGQEITRVISNKYYIFYDVLIIVLGGPFHYQSIEFIDTWLKLDRKPVT